MYSLLLLRGPALGAIACWIVLLTCQKLTGKFSALASFCSSICSCVCCCCCSSSSSSPSPPATPVVINSDYHLPPPPPPPTRPSKTANFISRSSMLQSKSHLLPSCCRTSSFSSSTSSSNQHSSSDLHHGDQPSVPPNSANTNLSSFEQQNSSLAIHQKRKSSSTTKQKSRNRIFCRHSSSRENDNVSPKQPSNSYSSYHRPSSSTGSGNELRSEAYSLSPSLLQIRESNGGVVGISNSSYVLSSHTSSSSAALLSHHSRSNVLTPSREIASITTACWLFLVATVPKLIDSGCQACLAPSPYPVITDEAPSPPLVHATVAKRGADFELIFSKQNSFFEKSFFLSFLDETTSCVLLPLLLLACHSRLRFSLILIIACLLSCCRGLSCRGQSCGRSGQRRPRKWCWSFGQSSSTAAAAARSSRSSSLRTSRTGGVGVNSTLSSQRYPSHHPFHHHLPTFHLSASSSAASSRQASIFPPPPPVFDESNLSAEFSRAGSFLRVNYPANSGSAAVASGERSLAVTIM